MKVSYITVSTGKCSIWNSAKWRRVSSSKTVDVRHLGKLGKILFSGAAHIFSQKHCEYASLVRIEFLSTELPKPDEPSWKQPLAVMLGIFCF